MNTVLREERKFLIGTSERYTLENKLNKILSEDAHNGMNGYIVRSLYFDTLHNKDFQDKEDGVELRRKIRLRVYNPDDDFAVLEIKQKQGNNQLKRSLKVAKEDAKQLIKGNYSSLLKYNEEFEAYIQPLVDIVKA